MAWNIVDPFPVSECYFVTLLAFEGLAAQTIKTYLAAIRFAQVVQGLPEPPSSPRLKLAMQGTRRLQGMLRRNPPRECLPITPSLLRRIKGWWDQLPSQCEHKMLWAAATLCFFGFFQSGELFVQSAGAFDERVHLAWGDVAVDDRSNPTCLRVHLKRSKCDQFGNGVNVVVGHTRSDICPVVAMVDYLAIRGSHPGPFFTSSPSSPLTKHHFVDAIREALQALGFPPNLYAGHSSALGRPQRLLGLGWKTPSSRHWADGAVPHSCHMFEHLRSAWQQQLSSWNIVHDCLFFAMRVGLT